MLPQILQESTLTRGFFVLVTPVIQSPGFLVSDGDLTLAILREGAAGWELTPEIDALTNSQRERWLTPFGWRPGSNIWDVWPPERPLHASQIRPQHRLPSEVQARIEACLAQRHRPPHRPPEPRVP